MSSSSYNHTKIANRIYDSTFKKKNEHFDLCHLFKTDSSKRTFCGVLAKIYVDHAKERTNDMIELDALLFICENCFDKKFFERLLLNWDRYDQNCEFPHEDDHTQAPMDDRTLLYGFHVCCFDGSSMNLVLTYMFCGVMQSQFKYRDQWNTVRSPANFFLVTFFHSYDKVNNWLTCVTRSRDDVKNPPKEVRTWTILNVFRKIHVSADTDVRNACKSELIMMISRWYENIPFHDVDIAKSHCDVLVKYMRDIRIPKRYTDVRCTPDIKKIRSHIVSSFADFVLMNGCHPENMSCIPLWKSTLIYEVDDAQIQTDVIEMLKQVRCEKGSELESVCNGIVRGDEALFLEGSKRFRNYMENLTIFTDIIFDTVHHGFLKSFDIFPSRLETDVERDSLKKFTDSISRHRKMWVVYICKHAPPSLPLVGNSITSTSLNDDDKSYYDMKNVYFSSRRYQSVYRT